MKTANAENMSPWLNDQILTKSETNKVNAGWSNPYLNR